MTRPVPNDAVPAEVVVRRAAVLGSPIAHSKSPLLHLAAYEALGLTDWRYDAVEVTEDALADFVSGLDRSWAGLSLTMPLKKAVLPLLDEVDWLAAEVAAVNTVVFTWPAVGDEATGQPHLAGYNTDVPGLVAALRESGVESVERVLVLGAGATAASALRAVVDLGCRQVDVKCRRPEAVEPLQSVAEPHGLVLQHVAWDSPLVTDGVDLVISTLPSAAADVIAQGLAGQPEAAAGLPPLFDVAYDPWPTPLAAVWSDRGGQVTGGLELLLHQAALQVPLMTGAAVPGDQLVSAMRAAL